MKTHRLMDGTKVVLEDLSRYERDFLRTIRTMMKHGASYFDIYRFSLGPGSPALQGRTRVDRDLFDAPLHQVAMDLAMRAGIEQGLILDPRYESLRPLAAQIESPLNVVETAHVIGVTRMAVYKAIKEGRLPHVRIGNVLLIRKADALAFRRSREARLKARTNRRLRSTGAVR